MDIKLLNSAINQLVEERGITFEQVIETIEAAIAGAYKKQYGKKGQIVKCKLDLKTGEVNFWKILQIVDESMIFLKEKDEYKDEGMEVEEIDEEKKKKIFNPERHITIDEAKKIKPDVKIGEEIEILLEDIHEDYGRIAAQTAKQIILQKIKEIERETVLEKYKTKEGEVVVGVVRHIEGKNVYFDIDKTIGILTMEEQIRGEFYKPGNRLKVYILRVENFPRGPIIFLSRAHPKLVSKLFEIESPEISAGTVIIKSIAREAGARTKIAVESKVAGIDPIGSIVGQRGTRVQAVINELGGEKIDIIEWSDDIKKYIANSLAPAKVIEVKIIPKNKSLVIVPENQLSLAIGKDGQNVRLASKVTGWKIDVRPSSEAQIDTTDEEGGEEKE